MWPAVLLAALLLAGCGRSQEPRPVAARVGSAVLTEDDLAAFDDSAATSPERRRAAIDRWVTNELLYQEALRRGYGEREDLRDRIARAARGLTVDAYLEDELFGEDVVEEDSVDAYYRVSGGQFVLREDVALVSEAAFDERDVANQFRARLLAGRPWDDAVRETRSDAAAAPHLLSESARRYVTASTLYPEALWKLARALRPDDVSFVAATDAGYHVIVLHRFQSAGAQADLAYVRDEIRNRVLIEQRRARYRNLLAELRQRHRVDLRPSAPAQ